MECCGLYSAGLMGEGDSIMRFTAGTSSCRGGGRFDIDDVRVPGVDQIIAGIGKEVVLAMG